MVHVLHNIFKLHTHEVNLDNCLCQRQHHVQRTPCEITCHLSSDAKWQQVQPSLSRGGIARGIHNSYVSTVGDLVLQMDHLQNPDVSGTSVRRMHVRQVVHLC